MEDEETEDLCSRLHGLSLLLTCDLGTSTIRLHDVVRNYLIQCVGLHLPALHAQFLDASQHLLGLERWADLPAEQHYFWHYLIWHLCQTGRKEALTTTLTGLSYLTRKALWVGIPALEADLLLAREFELSEPLKAIPLLFTFLHRTIRQISHLLRQVHTPAEMGGLLLSRVAWKAPFAAQRFTLQREFPRPFLTTWHPLPGRSSSALLRTLRGHNDWVSKCAMSPDDRFIISASDDGILKVWDAATGAEHLTLKDHTGKANACVVSPDGRFIVSASHYRMLKVWDAATGAERLTLKGHVSLVLGYAVSPDSRWIISASDDGTLKVWNATTGKKQLTLYGHTDWVRGCAVSPDSHFIVSASWDSTLKIWDAQSIAAQFTLRGHTGEINSYAVSPDGRFIASASVDQTLKRDIPASAGDEPSDSPP